MPERLKAIVDKEKVSIPMTKDFAPFKEWLLANN